MFHRTSTKIWIDQLPSKGHKNAAIYENYKQACRQLVRDYVKLRLICKPKECQCGKIANLHGHHENYLKPLDVIWLCSSCHKKEHAKLRRKNADPSTLLCECDHELPSLSSYWNHLRQVCSQALPLES